MNLWKKISNLGISDAIGHARLRSIILTNRLIYFSFATIISFVPLLYLLDIEAPIVLTIVLTIVSGFLFVLAARKKHQLALLFLIFIQITYTICLCVLEELVSVAYLGDILHLFLVPNLLIGIVLMDKIKYSFTMAIIVVSSYFVIELLKYNAGHQQSEFTTPFLILYIVDVMTIFMSITYYIYQFKLINYDYTVDILHQKQYIEQQHTELEFVHNEMQGSIKYAKRIQSAILPSDRLVKAYFEDSFIFYKPKDVVAGDFYWSESVDDHIYFAVADCTGHGVPGALVSIVCNNALNRAVREFGMRTTGDILDKTKEIVIHEFEKSEENVSDGMDIAMIKLPLNLDFKKKTTLEYSGANNPLWLLRENDIQVIKACKQPIGKYYKSDPFKTHQVEIKPNDQLYIFSDGYVDQFGGEYGKKFKNKAFRSLLLSIKDMGMTEQRSMIKNTFYNWKDNHEQVDDVCVIGLRV